jgi:uncharacterized RDD family membrane protein YckC
LNLPDPTDSVEFQRGGFWRRALAALIDLIAITAVLQLVALGLFPLSNGRVQFTGGVIFANTCHHGAAGTVGPRRVRRQFDCRLPA